MKHQPEQKAKELLGGGLSCTGHQVPNGGTASLSIRGGPAKYCSPKSPRLRSLAYRPFRIKNHISFSGCGEVWISGGLSPRQLSLTKRFNPAWQADILQDIVHTALAGRIAKMCELDAIIFLLVRTGKGSPWILSFQARH
jgi:hypothetical protein